MNVGVILPSCSTNEEDDEITRLIFQVFTNFFKEVMLLKGRKNLTTASAIEMRQIADQATGSASWHPSMSVSFGFNPGKLSNSLMLRDKGQQPMFAANAVVNRIECLVGGYLFNQHC